MLDKLCCIGDLMLYCFMCFYITHVILRRKSEGMDTGTRSSNVLMKAMNPMWPILFLTNTICMPISYDLYIILSKLLKSGDILHYKGIYPCVTFKAPAINTVR